MHITNGSHIFALQTFYYLRKQSMLTEFESKIARIALADMGILQNDFSDKLRKSRTTVANVLCGRTNSPTIERAARELIAEWHQKHLATMTIKLNEWHHANRKYYQSASPVAARQSISIH